MVVVHVEQKHDAKRMAELVEKWLGNRISKKIMRFCTKRCSCGRRIEIILRDYAGDKQKMCKGCKMSGVIVAKVLDKFIDKADIEKEEIFANLRDPMWRKGLASVLPT